MTTTAFQTLYRPEYIATFERTQSILRATTVTEANINGNTAVFLVSGSGGATASTRGTNGLIPARNNSNTQNSCTLVELNDLVEGTKFTYDLSQGNQRRLQQESSVGVINRSIDDQIIAELDNATNDTGSAQTADLDLVTTAQAFLASQNVDIEQEDNMFGLITPAFNKYLNMIPQYASADYVDVKPFNGPARKMRRWMGVNWMVHSGLTGMNTNLEKCYMYHRNAIGHAANSAGVDAAAGFDGRQAIYWARASMFCGAKLLQNSGIVQMKHDGSAVALS
jgi:hypothetical protein